MDVAETSYEHKEVLLEVKLDILQVILETITTQVLKLPRPAKRKSLILGHQAVSQLFWCP